MGGDKFMRARVTAWDMLPNNTPEFSDETRYCIWSKEKCPETGRLHYQIFMKFKKAVTLKHINTIWGKGIKVLHCDASDEANIMYASKEETHVEGPWEFGENCKERERVDLKKVYADIKNGKTVDELTEDNPDLYHMYGRTITKLETIQNRRKFRTWMTTCDWYYGETGTGKSEEAFKDFSPETHYVGCVEDGGFWDGYSGQKIVILDDFRGEISYAQLLKLIDKNPTYVKKKGIERYPFLSEKIIITSSLHPKDINWELAAGDSINQLIRRVNIIAKKKEPEKAAAVVPTSRAAAAVARLQKAKQRHNCNTTSCDGVVPENLDPEFTVDGLEYANN